MIAGSPHGLTTDSESTDNFGSPRVSRGYFRVFVDRDTGSDLEFQPNCFDQTVAFRSEPVICHIKTPEKP